MTLFASSWPVLTVLGSPPPVEPEVGDKVKETMETSPGTANIADKVKGCFG